MGQPGKIAEIARMSNHGMHRFAVAWVSLLLAGCSIYPMDGTLNFHVIGQVTVSGTHAPVAGLIVGVLENANSFDQYHASAITDAGGNFTLDFSSSRCVKWYLVSTRSDPMRISCELGVKGVVMNIVIPTGR
jgi:hypothetical protein